MNCHKRYLACALTAFVCLVALSSACGGGGNDDHSIDDDAVDDDVDDDLVADDDATDDDAVLDDDSIDEDGAPVGLLVIGQDGEGWASWRKQPDGWLREEMPLSDAPADEVFLGPSFFLNGEKGWTAWNEWSVQQTWGYELLAYDAQSGWARDTYHQPPDILPPNLNFIFAPDENNLWIIDNVWMLFYLDSYYLGRYVGDAPHQELSTLAVSWLAMFFPDADSGLVSASFGGVGLLARWDSGAWSSEPIPASYRAGVLNWMWLEDAQHGWFVWELESDFHRKLLRFDNGEWSEVTPPPGCEDSDPWRVFGAADYAVTLDRPSPDDRFWEYRDGSWSCRRLTGAGSAAQQETALVRRDGRVFVLTSDQTQLTSALFEVAGDAVRRLGLPPGVRVYALHDLGAEAPRFSITE